MKDMSLDGRELTKVVMLALVAMDLEPASPH
jgi:hypothetical protein